ncbi:MAG TPA: hydroxypyruvate isomerase, partial [Aestuariivirga sp.]
MSKQSPFTLSACAEMLWRDKPIEWRCAKLKDLGFEVGLWNWPQHDLAKLEKSGAKFSIMNGYLRGSLADDEGAAELIKTARETAQVAKRLNVARLNLLGTALGDRGLPTQPVEVVTGAMWLKARDTLCRIVELAEQENVTFTLENLNVLVDHP